jgi:type VI protein secretion system component VasF
MIRILPDFTEARDALRRLQMTAGERRRRTLLRVVAPVVFLLLLAVAAAWYGYEIHVQRLFDAALQDAAALRARCQIQEASESLQRAR